MSTASDLRQRANAIADALSKRDWIDAVCLFGSVARGDETPWSDIDLLVIGSRAEATKAKIVGTLPAGLRESQLSLLYRSSDELTRLSEEQGIFVDHIRREGIVLLD